MTNQTARALLDRHGLPEDVIDGALCLHAQELAALQRLRMEELDLTGQKARIVGRIVDLIDPTRTPAAAPAAVEPPADQTTPSHRAALREQLAAALYERERPPRDPHWPKAFAADREVFEAMADAVLAVLYREWPWLRAEAEDAAPADHSALCGAVADVLTPYFANFCNEEAAEINAREAADVAERVAIRRHEQHEIEREQGALDVMTVLRRMADGCPQCSDTGACNGGPCPLRRMADETATGPAQSANAEETTDDAARRFARRLLAVELLCSGRPGYHTLTVKQVLTAISEADDEPAAGARQDGATP